MLSVAADRARAADALNVSFRQADAQKETLATDTVDGVVSRFGVMFFADPVAAFANLRSALRPTGRIAFTCWQEVLRNDWIMIPSTAALAHIPLPSLDGMGGPGPFAFANPDATRSMLTAAGCSGISIVEVVEPMYLGEDVDDAVSFMRQTDFADIRFAGA